MSIINGDNNSRLFLNYLIENGLNKNDNILEIGNSVLDSMSIYLKELEFNQFLLSIKVDINELQRLELNGANGYVTLSGALINKIFINNKNILLINDSKLFLNSFSTIICEGDSIDLINCRSFNGNIYFGLCFDKPELGEKGTPLFFKNIIKSYTEEKELLKGMKIEVIHDTDKKAGKEYYLFKRNLIK